MRAEDENLPQDEAARAKLRQVILPDYRRGLRRMLYTIYTDRSCLKNPGGPGGYAAVIFREGEMIEELSGGEAITTSNRMEITAAMVGLRQCGSLCHHTVL